MVSLLCALFWFVSRFHNSTSSVSVRHLHATWTVGGVGKLRIKFPPGRANDNTVAPHRLQSVPAQMNQWFQERLLQPPEGTIFHHEILEWRVLNANNARTIHLEPTLPPPSPQTTKCRPKRATTTSPKADNYISATAMRGSSLSRKE